MRARLKIRWALLFLLLGGMAALTPASFAQAFGLTLIDINNPVAGELTDNGNGSWTVTAGGNDTWDVADSFTYLYEKKDGDFDVKVNVLDVQVDDAAQQDSAKGSLHMRANLTPGSPDVMINATPVAGANYVETIWRPTQDTGVTDPPVNSFFPGNGPYPGTFRVTPLYPVWLRLQRRGNIVVTMTSKDGINWDGLAEYNLDPAKFPKTVYVGLSTVAHIDPITENTLNRVRATYASYGDASPVAAIGGVAAAADLKPGILPTTSVTAVNVKISDPSDGIFRNAAGASLGFITYNAANKNEYIASIEGQGPIAWSIPGYNQGDLDISLSPRDPLLAQSNLGPYSNPNRDRNQDGADAVRAGKPQSQAWLPSTRDGIVLGSIRKNGQQWNDNGAGGPTPLFHAFSSVSIDFSSRKGYSMVGGNFENGEIYYSFYKIGDLEPALPGTSSPFALREANIDVALAWFPFAQGWKAGYIHDATRAPSAFWRKQGSHSSAAVEGTTDPNNTAGALVQWLLNPEGAYGGLAALRLPGVTSRAPNPVSGLPDIMDGMLFVTSNDDESNNEGQHTSAIPAAIGNGYGWTIGIHQDDTDPDPTHLSLAQRSEFSFLYVPYNAQKLIGGHIVGVFGDIIRTIGNVTFDRLADGRYQLTIPGKTGHDGMLLLQNAGYHPDFLEVPDDAVLSYEYAGNNQFVIESHTVAKNGVDADSFPLRDADFYFVWVDFTDPLQPPPPCHVAVVPIGGSPPGPCPNTSVSAANWVAKGSAAGFNGNAIVNIEGNGPIPWSMPRYNRGDFAIRLSPADPAAAAADTLNQGFIQISHDSAVFASAQAWDLNPNRGMIMASCRQNGPIDYNDGSGPFYPTIATSGGASGFGYDQVDGTFRNFGAGSIDINTGRAGGEGGASPEQNFNFGTAWFPYDQGWVGGVQGNPNADGSAKWDYPDGHSPGLLASVMTWFNILGGTGKLALPGVHSLNDGMLFTINCEGSSALNIMASAPASDGSGWVVSSREDSAVDPLVLATGQSQFKFVYVPYNAQRLIGGHINGATGGNINARGSLAVTRTEAGVYELSIPGKSGSSGILLLQNASLVPGSTTVADNHFFSYEYDSGRNVFVIQSRSTDGTTTGAPLGDADFYVLYVDFTNPVAPPSKTPAPATPPSPNLISSLAGTQLTLSWTGAGFQLQANDDLNNHPNGWVTVPGGALSPVIVDVNTAKRFFRLAAPY